MACPYCEDGNEPVEGPNGYLWHEWSGEDPEPCWDDTPQRVPSGDRA